ncbi:MAG: UDP-N-acetyl-D-glucosamine dehydrogenase, partial [Chloroflexi bacterium]|nr:UDP-N-acetyl-D-glucosamine dehydrogenase [Chloroflexota bacterium]
MKKQEDLRTQLEKKIAARQAHIVVIGLGYVGLPLAVELARLGYGVDGLEVDPARVEAIAAGRSYIGDVPAQAVSELVKRQRLRATSDYAILRQADAIFICVPTPFDEAKAPDLSYVVAAARGIAEHLQPGQLIILQSTTYPGTT